MRRKYSSAFGSLGFLEKISSHSPDDNIDLKLAVKSNLKQIC